MVSRDEQIYDVMSKTSPGVVSKIQEMVKNGYKSLPIQAQILEQYPGLHDDPETIDSLIREAAKRGNA